MGDPEVSAEITPLPQLEGTSSSARTTADKSITSNRRGGPKLSPQSIAMREELGNLLQSRQPVDVKALAEKYRVTTNSIYKAMYSMGKQPTHTLPEETKEALKAALPDLWRDTTIPMLEIAEKFGVSLSTIDAIRRDIGLPKRERSKLPQTLSMITALPGLVAKGISSEMIAERFGVSVSTVNEEKRNLEKLDSTSQAS